jgi:hypothetical protein
MRRSHRRIFHQTHRHAPKRQLHLDARGAKRQPGLVRQRAPAANPPSNAGPGIYRLIAKPVDPNATCSEQADWAINVPARPAKPTAILGEKKHLPRRGLHPTKRRAFLAQNNLLWTVQNGPGAATTDQPGNPVNVTWGATGPRSLVVRQISTDGLGCQSDTARLSVAAISTPLISGKVNVCEDATATYTLGSLQNVDIQWRIVPFSAGAIAGGQGTSTVEIFWSQPGGHSLEVDVCGQNRYLPGHCAGSARPDGAAPSGGCVRVKSGRCRPPVRSPSTPGKTRRARCSPPPLYAQPLAPGRLRRASHRCQRLHPAPRSSASRPSPAPT